MPGIAPDLLLGLLAAAFSGLIGVGGGVIVVPARVYLFGMGMHQERGITLAMLMPPGSEFQAGFFKPKRS